MSTPQQDSFLRDYSSISPSARALLLMKGYTDIPFARKVAELMLHPEKYIPDFSDKDLRFWARVLHFEARYKSIDRLLTGLPVKNILELSSGFSFRGLDTINKKEVHYIDTDLPDVISLKEKFVHVLKETNSRQIGLLEIHALNALDEQQFSQLAGHFPAGELAIVNEGLLMYLGMEEKTRLCEIIRKILKQYGGYWITADIYLRKGQDDSKTLFYKSLSGFLEVHRVEENKFDSFEAAESFFRQAGFVIDKRDVSDHSGLSSFPYFVNSATREQLNYVRKRGRIRASWRLKVA